MPLPDGAEIGPLTVKHVWLLVDALHLTREVSYGALALLLWDMCLTFADEVGTPRSFHLVARNRRLLPYRLTQCGLQDGALQMSCFLSTVMSHR